MAFSQNGWAANDRSRIRSFPLPGGAVALRDGPAGELLAYVARRFHAEVEPLVWPGCWGYAERPIRGSTTTLSNHASGTAIDLNAPKHPLGTDPATNFTKAQITAIKRIVADCGGAVRWGGDYIGRKDGMHFEIDAPEATVALVWARIQQQAAPSPSPAHSEEDDLMAAKDEIIAALRGYPFKTLHSDKALGGTGEMGLAAPGHWIPVRNLAYLKGYRAHGWCHPTEQLNLAPNWFTHYKAEFTSAQAQPIDVPKLAKELVAELPDDDLRELADTDVEQFARAAADEIDRRQRERLGDGPAA